MVQDYDDQLLGNQKDIEAANDNPNEQKRLIAKDKIRGVDQKLQRRNTIAVGHKDVQSQRQKLRAWYDQYSVANEKNKRRALFTAN